MAGSIQFAVSTPCNTKNQRSGYKLLTYTEDNKLSVIRTSQLRNKDIFIDSDTDVTVQAFCYIKPREREITPPTSNDGIMDYSDYFFVAKSNGLIEIIQDYKYKISKHETLEADYVLRCTPEDYSSGIFPDFVIVSLEYKDGLLYCCMSSGKVYIFVLNVPSDYIQIENFQTVRKYSNIFKHSRTGAHFDDERYNTRENSEFIEQTQFTGRSQSSLQHICYYLTPIDPPKSSVPRTILYYTSLYKKQHIYRPSIYICLEQNISAFHINPFDKFSFLTVSPRNPIMIRRVIISLTYLNYFETFLQLKQKAQQKYQQELIPWEKLAFDNGFESFAYWMVCESVYGYEGVSSSSWNDIVENNGTGNLNATIVWRENQAEVKDPSDDIIYKIMKDKELDYFDFSSGERDDFRYASSSINRIRDHLYSRSNDMRREMFRRRNNNIDIPNLHKSALDVFVKNVKKNTFITDFRIVELNNSDMGENIGVPRERQPTILTNHDDENDMEIDELSSPTDSDTADHSSSSISESDVEPYNSEDEDDDLMRPSYPWEEGERTITSFLTNRYKKMNIIAIDRFLTINVFKPKFQDDAFLKIEPLENLVVDQTMSRDDMILARGLEMLSSFKKLYMLTDSLCLILDIHGLLLIDLRKVQDCKNLLNNEISALKMIPFNIGLITDSLLSIEAFESSKIYKGFDITFRLIITCLPNEIKAFTGSFQAHTKIGSISLTDRVKLNKQNKFVDKLALIGDGVSKSRSDVVHDRKRSRSESVEKLDKFWKSVKTKAPNED
ncbi:hypothetical protein KAFR_0L01150 [Kazachstania africana CBS 2517]|uniref:Uncharacterized protein n=1 Tax=Kazachstania africana (strain ATCC 22294 / BCRC 22015 / CBS 2517 / CECT 1963 / NBRC 1671 / NRRL Y-8276) TaxID=1071382 RepID=H2B273_KAZAF|nr:hypothetical protein KAFR_0L01150 [Kazachstania africana CBS 2517]CCF60723.1 hypothetical protein KAFR_0L01150 [Kazachstania africana CBS 2517]